MYSIVASDLLVINVKKKILSGNESKYGIVDPSRINAQQICECRAQRKAVPQGLTETT
jgi:hypothetical protein